MNSICRINDEDLIQSIKKAKERILFIAPGISKMLVEALSNRLLDLGPEKVNIILDNDPEVYRLGYGEIEALQLLQNIARKSDTIISHQPGIRICLLVADNDIIVFSPTPKLIEAGSKQQTHPNAIRLDSLPENVAKDVGLGADGIMDQLVGLKNIKSDEVKKVEEDLKQNPPQKFDVARQVRVFNAFFEFVDFKLEDCFISRKTVPIPSYLLKILKDPSAQERLRGSFLLIDRESELSDKEISNLRKEVSKYLISLKGYGSVILRSNKQKFDKAIEELRKKVNDFQEKVTKKLKAEIDKNKKSLIDGLLPLVEKNIPDKWIKFIGTNPSENMIRNMLDEELTTAFGKAENSIKQMKVTAVYKGVTYESLKDEHFLNTVQKAGLDINKFHRENNAALSI